MSLSFKSPMNYNAFSLTPALSRWERGNAFQFFGETRMASGLRDFQKTVNVQLLFPLLRGEGQGEGIATTLSKPIIFCQHF